MELENRLLQLHALLQTVRRGSPPPDDAVNLLLNAVDGLFHDGGRVNLPQA